jgi:hypothetical protein
MQGRLGSPLCSRIAHTRPIELVSQRAVLDGRAHLGAHQAALLHCWKREGRRLGQCAHNGKSRGHPSNTGEEEVEECSMEARTSGQSKPLLQCQLERGKTGRQRRKHKALWPLKQPGTPRQYLEGEMGEMTRCQLSFGEALGGYLAHPLMLP